MQVKSSHHFIYLGHGCTELRFSKCFAFHTFYGHFYYVIIFVKYLLVQILRGVCFSEAINFALFFSLLFELRACIIIVFFLNLPIACVAISNLLWSPFKQFLIYDYCQLTLMFPFFSFLYIFSFW